MKKAAYKIFYIGKKGRIRLACGKNFDTQVAAQDHVMDIVTSKELVILPCFIEAERLTIITERMKRNGYMQALDFRAIMELGYPLIDFLVEGGNVSVKTVMELISERKISSVPVIEFLNKQNENDS